MLVLVRSSSTTCITTHGFHAQRQSSSTYRIWNDVVCPNCYLDTGSKKQKVFGKLSTVYELHKASLVGKYNSWGHGYMRKGSNLVVLSGFELGLVCEEVEVGNSIQTGEYGSNSRSYEDMFTVRDDHHIEASSSATSSDSGGRVRMLESKLHFLEERDEEIMSRRILSLSRSNKVKSALELYNSMEALGLRPNRHACNSLLSCLLRSGSLDDALTIFMLMKEKDIATGHTFSLILKEVARVWGCDSSLKLFAELEGDVKLKSSFDVIVYNTMISVCGKGNDWVQMEKMWKKLKESGYVGTSVTYSLLITNFIRCGQSELALDAYHEMIHNQLKPGEDVLKAAVVACAKEGKWDSALRAFRYMLESGLKPNAITYNTLINCLGKSGKVDLAFRIYYLMKSSGHTADVYTWNALLGALYRRGRYADTLRLFEQIRREKSSELNNYVYNVALMSCQKLALWDRSLQLLWQMEASGLSVSTISYNHVISACEAARKPKVALLVYKHMIHEKCTPDTFTYLSIIRACIWGSLWKQAEEVLDCVTPNASLYNALVHGMCLRGQSVKAKKLYMRMRECGFQADGKTRALMLQLLTND